MIKSLSLEEWTNDFACFLAKESIKLLIYQGAKRGGDVVVDLLITRFIKAFIESVITSSLLRKPQGIKTEEENYDFSSRTFLYTKLGIQNAIAEGMSAAVDKFSSVKIDYFCDITTIEDPKSRELN